MIEKIKELIEEEMTEYAQELQIKLEEKYLKEFAKELYEHRNKVVLRVISKIQLELKHDCVRGETSIQIKF